MAATLLEEPPRADNNAVDAAEQAWRPLGELLVEKGLLTEEELADALAAQKESGRMLGAILVERGYVSGPAVAVALAKQYGVELATERGFGTGLWAEIDRRHRAGRTRAPRDNVVHLETKPASLEAVPDPEPALEELQQENQRLQDKLQRFRGESAGPRIVEEAEQPSSHVLFVPTARGYRLVERDGAPPALGSALELSDPHGSYLVAKLARAPLPGKRRPCAYLILL